MFSTQCRHKTACRVCIIDLMLKVSEVFKHLVSAPGSDNLTVDEWHDAQKEMWAPFYRADVLWQRAFTGAKS